MRRLCLLVAAALTFGLVTAASGCTPPLSCSNPTKLTGTQGTLHFPPYVVQQDQWTGQGQQTMWVCNERDWKAVANQTGAPSTGVKTYPDSGKTYTDWQYCSSQPVLSSFSKLSSSFAFQGPTAGAWDAGYDVFLNGGVCGKPVTEIMVWNQWRGLSVPAAQSHPTIGGVAYDVYHSGGYIQVRRHVQATSATTDLLAIFRYLEGQGLVRAADTLQFVQYGAEILTTYGNDLTFRLTGFSVADARASSPTLGGS